MTVSQASRSEAQLITAYADQLMAHEQPNTGQVGDARQNRHMRGVEKETGADLQGVEEAVKFFESTRSQRTGDAFEIVGLKDESRADRKAGEDKRAGRRIQGWHETMVKRTGQDLEKLGFDVQRVQVGTAGDTFSGTVQVGEGDAARTLPFELVMNGQNANRTLFEATQQMAEQLAAENGGGITACKYDTAVGEFEYTLPNGMIRLAGQDAAADFNTGLTAYATLQGHVDGATDAQATGTFAVEDGKVDVEYNNPIDGAKAWLQLGDVSGMNSSQIQDAFARAVITQTDARPATQILAETKTNLQAPGYPIDEKVFDTLALGGLQGSDGVTDDDIIDVVIIALNADGKTDEGRQLNEAGINALGELQDSPRATEILDRIALRTPSEEYYFTAVQSLAQMAGNSGAEVRAQTVAVLEGIQRSAEASTLACLKGADAAAKQAALAHVGEMIAKLTSAGDTAVADGEST